MHTYFLHICDLAFILCLQDSAVLVPVIMAVSVVTATLSYVTAQPDFRGHAASMVSNIWPIIMDLFTSFIDSIDSET